MFVTNLEKINLFYSILLNLHIYPYFFSQPLFSARKVDNFRLINCSFNLDLLLDDLMYEETKLFMECNLITETAYLTYFSILFFTKNIYLFFSFSFLSSFLFFNCFSSPPPRLS